MYFITKGGFVNSFFKIFLYFPKKNVFFFDFYCGFL